MSRTSGVSCTAAVALVAAAVGCSQKGGPRPQDAFGLADANVVVAGDLAGVVGSKFYADVKTELAKLPGMGGGEQGSIDDAVKGAVGLAPADLRSVVAYANTDLQKLVLVAVAKGPVDRDAVIAALSEGGEKFEKVETHAGVDLLAPPDESNEVLAFPAADLIVAGTKDEIKKGIDRLKAGEACQATGKAAEVVRAAPKGSGLVVAVAPTPGLATMAAGAAPVPGVDEAMDKVVAVTVVANAAEALDLRIVAEFKTDEDAADAQDQAVEGIDGLKAQLGPVLDQGGMEPLKALFDGVKVARTGKRVEVTAAVRADVVKTVPAIMGTLMMQLMGGGMPGTEDAPFETEEVEE